MLYVELTDAEKRHLRDLTNQYFDSEHYTFHGVIGITTSCKRCMDDTPVTMVSRPEYIDLAGHAHSGLAELICLRCAKIVASVFIAEVDGG